MATQCKLYTETPQVVPPKEWTTVQFTDVLRDDRGMYRGNGLVVPPQDGDYLWLRSLRWADIVVPDGDGRQRQFMERFCRDPYGSPDDTGSSGEPDGPGDEFALGAWAFFGKAGRPVAVQVWHDHSAPVEVRRAQFVAMTWDY